ncbi:glycerol-3-phosphate 1-O-acyltransferase PlsY [bacterium]|nr:glycerol-3-phosphate 1-O-acyltransferase PlsY [bacterium]
MMEILIFVILAYVIGSFPTGYIVVKLATGKDIRTIGSGSTGATNVKRVMGKKWFFFVLLFDAFKGALPVVLAKMFATEFTGIGLIPVLAAAAVIIGHSKSLFLKFSGGKSVASGVGTILALNPIVGGIIAVVWACVTYFSKYVSLGSIIALCLSPI